MFLRSKFFIALAFFVLIILLFTHSFTSVHQDIGRHITLGRIIWETHHVPSTNVFSFTEPNHEFINHHWLSEVAFYWLDRLGGLKGIIVFKVLILSLVYLILYYVKPQKNQIIWILFALISVFIFIDRTEARPEIFSYLFLVLFFLLLYRVRDRIWSDRWLWLLVPIELLWVNAHIYFVIGIGLYGIFLVEQFIQKRITRQQIMVGVLLGLVTSLNPEGIKGALYPLTIFRDYGYPVTENKSVLSLVSHIGRWPFHLKIFIASLFVVSGGIIFRLRVLKKYIFEIITLSCLVYGAFTMLRNVSLYALGFLPIASAFLADIKLGKRWQLAMTCVVSCILGIFIVIVPTNIFYSYLDTSRRFGLDIPDSAKSAVDFVKANRIQGNVFNDFDIGSYLVWKLYPDQNVFCDGRPEAYSYEFWQKIYIPMQSDYATWKTLSLKYGINYVFFDHNDNSPWAHNFLEKIYQDHEWAMVYVNDVVVIFLRRNEQNAHVIRDYELTNQNIIERLDATMLAFSTNDDSTFRGLGRFLYQVGDVVSSGYVYDRLAVLRPKNAYAFQGKAYALSALDTVEGYSRAAVAMERAIELGVRAPSDYFLLALSQAKTGKRSEALKNLAIVLRKDPSYRDAVRLRELLQK